MQVKIDGQKLFDDYKSAGVSFEKFFLDSRPFARSTFYAAIGKNSSTESMLRLFAREIGQPPERYLASADGGSTVSAVAAYDLSGDWVNLILEAGYLDPPTWKRERIRIFQSGLEISGTYFDEAAELDDGIPRDSKFEMQGQLIGNCIIGLYRREGRRNPMGSGVFQLRITAPDWCVGACTYWANSGSIGCSQNIMLRADPRELEKAVKRAQNILKTNLWYFEV